MEMETRKLSSGDLKAAAYLLGIIDDYSLASVHKVNGMAEAQIAKGRTFKSKAGPRQNDKTQYWAKVDPRDAARMRRRKKAGGGQ